MKKVENHCARAYNQSDKLEGRFVVDLAKRLPFSTRQDFLKYLSSRFGHTNEPSFQSLFEFVLHEKECKSSDFGILLSSDRDDVRGAKESLKNKSICPVRQTLVGSPDKSELSLKNSRRRYNNVIANKSDSVEYSTEAPACIFCCSKGRHERYWLANCRGFLELSPSERKNVIIKAGRCLNCLRKHMVKNCLFPNKCRTCGAACSQKHSFLLHELYVTSPESRKAVDRESEVAGSAPTREVTIASVKAAFNRVTAVRLISPDIGKSKLVYCQHDPGSQLTFVSSKLVSELKLKAFDNVLFDMDTMIGKKSNTANLVKFNIQSLYNDEMFFNITSVVNES